MKGMSPFWMVLCCLVPVGLGAGLYFAGWISGFWAVLLIMLVCPLMHFLPMGSHKGHTGSGDGREG